MSRKLLKGFSVPLIIAAILIAAPVFSQDNSKAISGTVTDGETGEGLPVERLGIFPVRKSEDSLALIAMTAKAFKMIRLDHGLDMATWKRILEKEICPWANEQLGKG